MVGQAKARKAAGMILKDGSGRSDSRTSDVVCWASFDGGKTAIALGASLIHSAANFFLNA